MAVHLIYPRYSLLLPLLLTVATLLAPCALATSYAPPRKTEYTSPNGIYKLKVNPKTKRHSVHRGWRRLWSFKRDVWHTAYFVSNDGKRVAWVDWDYCGADLLESPGVIIYSRNGVEAQFTIGELSRPKRYDKGDELGRPIGDHWRIWQEGARQEGDTIIIDVIGRVPARIPLHGGNKAR